MKRRALTRGSLLVAAFAAVLFIAPAYSREAEGKWRLTNWVDEGVFICESVCPTIGPLGPQCCQTFQL